MQKEDKKTLISQSEDGVIGPMDEGLDHNDDSKDLLESGRQTKTSRDLYFHYLKRTIYSLLIIFSFATILSHYFFPVVYTYGDDMSPKVNANSLLIGNKLAKINQGDIVAYYYGNETIVSRVLALPGQLVERDKKGNIKVDGEIKAKDYSLINRKKDNIKVFSIRVPEESIFVLKDKSKLFINDENKDLFIIKNKQVISKMFMILWPTNNIKIL